MKNDTPIIKENSLVIDLLPLFYESKNRLVCVANEAMKIVGVISEGDLLRFILRDGDFNSPAYKLMTTDFIYCFVNEVPDRKKFMDKRISGILVLNKDLTLNSILSVYDFIDAKVHNSSSC